MAHALTWIVEAVLRKLYTESMVRTAVKTGDETFHSLLGQKFQGSELSEVVGLKIDGHGKNKDSPNDNAPRCRRGVSKENRMGLTPSASRASL